MSVLEKLDMSESFFLIFFLFYFPLSFFVSDRLRKFAIDRYPAPNPCATPPFFDTRFLLVSFEV